MAARQLWDGKLAADTQSRLCCVFAMPVVVCGMPTIPRHIPRLPACVVCSQRKIKCDNSRPRCMPCSKADIDCVIHVGGGREPLTRAVIHELEQRASALSDAASAVEEEDGCCPDIDGVSGAAPQSCPYVSDGSGLSFMRLLFADSEWRESNTHLLRNLSQVSHIPEATARPNTLPSPYVARILFDKYLSGSHVQNPFLLRQTIESLYSRVFGTEHTVDTPTSHDVFRAFMIMAIGSVTLHRSGSHPADPFGYYSAAMQHYDEHFLANGLEAIQDLLLIGRFGIYYHIGTSIWDITHLCVRMCIEQGLHQSSNSRSDLLGQQLRRRVFWECYVIDRYSSNTLHRPFAIAERDITVGFPAEANDEAIMAAQQVFPDLDAFRAAHVPPALSEMSVFFVCIHLRQIVSRIHSAFSRFVEPDAHNGFQNFLLTGQICQVVDELFRELDEWRASAPVFPDPGSLYESQDWFDLLHFRERLILVRKAVDLVPKRNGIPPDHLLENCLECATSTIKLYSTLFQQGRITYTRSYFQMMFTAGLSAMFCVSASGNLRSAATQETLRVCEGTLRNMGNKLADSTQYVTVYEALHRNIARKWETTSLGASPTIIPQDVAPCTAPDSSLLNADDLVMAQEGGRNGGAGHIARNIPSSQLDFADNPGQSIHPWIPMAQDAAFLGNEPLHWGFLNDDTFWNMEAGLGEYAYGDLNANSNMARAFDFTEL